MTSGMWLWIGGFFAGFSIGAWWAERQYYRARKIWEGLVAIHKEDSATWRNLAMHYKAIVESGRGPFNHTSS